MKTCLRFLSGNMIYTALEVFGLGIVLGFMIILSAYVIDGNSIDREVNDKSRLWVCHDRGLATSAQKLDKIFDVTPEIVDWCQFTNHGTSFYIKANDLSYSEKPLYVSRNFFEFMGYELVDGNASELWRNEKSVVISETFAHNMYPGAQAVGRTLTFTCDDESEEPFWNTYTITGVYRNPERSIVMDYDIILNMDSWPSVNTSGYDFGSANLLRLARGTDRKDLCEKLYREAAENGLVSCVAGQPEPLMLTAFDDMDINVAKDIADPFINLTDKKMMRRFMTVCMILMGLAILNYIFLTIAFSRFRQKSLTIRSVLESYGLTVIAFAVGIAVASIVQDKASAILDNETGILSNPEEIIWSIILIVLLPAVTVFVPALVSSEGKPGGILKGGVGKAVIFTQTAASIVLISITLVYWLQIRRMLDTPLGYRTENVLCIKGIPFQVPVSLESLPCIDKVGRIRSLPVDGAVMKIKRNLADEPLDFHMTMCDSNALSILGIELKELFRSDKGPSGIFVTESSAQQIRNLCSSKGMSADRIKDICDGVISEMRYGNHTTASEGITALVVHENRRLPDFVVEFDGEVEEVKQTIRAYLDKIDVREYFHGYQVHFAPEIKTMDELVEESYGKEKDNITLIGLFALISMILTAMTLVAFRSMYPGKNIISD